MKLTNWIKNLLNDERFQLIYGICLIILIPLVIFFNATFIINRYNETIDVSLQRRGLSIGRVFSSLAQEDLQQVDLLQKKADQIRQGSPDILSIQILTPQESGFQIVASTDPESINQEVDFYYYNLAWQQPSNEALATDSLALSSVEGEIDPEFIEQQERFWLVSMPLLDQEKNKIALLSMKLSSKVVDEMTSYTWRASLYSLTLTILITILFLAVSTRLWGYATLYRKIKELDQMKDEFISIASHELRTPITAIRGYTSMVIEGTFGQITPKIKQGLERIMTSTNRLGELVEELLNVSRIEQGRIQLELKPLDPIPIIQEVVNELSIMAREKNLKLNFNKTTKVPEIFADSDKLKQILLNIIGNAIKYTDKGSVDISSGVKKNKVEIKIKDSGIGMSPEAQKHLFKKFFRVQNERTKKITGTGLGLWITKQLIELMKGNIYIESMEGVGTQVTVIFPIHQ